jgi:hypothetical protein
VELGAAIMSLPKDLVEIKWAYSKCPYKHKLFSHNFDIPATLQDFNSIDPMQLEPVDILFAHITDVTLDSDSMYKVLKIIKHMQPAMFYVDVATPRVFRKFKQHPLLLYIKDGLDYSVNYHQFPSDRFTGTDFKMYCGIMIGFRGEGRVTQNLRKYVSYRSLINYYKNIFLSRNPDSCVNRFEVPTRLPVNPWRSMLETDVPNKYYLREDTALYNMTNNILGDDLNAVAIRGIYKHPKVLNFMFKDEIGSRQYFKVDGGIRTFTEREKLRLLGYPEHYRIYEGASSSDIHKMLYCTHHAQITNCYVNNMLHAASYIKDPL